MYKYGLGFSSFNFFLQKDRTVYMLSEKNETEFKKLKNTHNMENGQKIWTFYQRQYTDVK